MGKKVRGKVRQMGKGEETDQGGHLDHWKDFDFYSRAMGNYWEVLSRGVP